MPATSPMIYTLPFNFEFLIFNFLPYIGFANRGVILNCTDGMRD